VTKEATVAERVAHCNGVYTWNWSWCRSSLIDTEVIDLQSCVQLLSSKQWYKDKKDTWICGDVLDGENMYSTSERNLIIMTAKIIQWNSWVPPKVNTLVCRANMDRIPTRDALSKRGVPIQNPLCPACSDQVESNDHVFTSCSFISLVWSFISSWLKIAPIFAFSFDDLLKIHDHASKDKSKKKMIQAIVYSTIWCVWKQRNELIFNGSQPSVINTVGYIKAISFLWVKNRSKYHNINWQK